MVVAVVAVVVAVIVAVVVVVVVVAIKPEKGLKNYPSSLHSLSLTFILLQGE